MTAYALLFTLAAIGISETAYLIQKQIARERPICVIGENCHEVLESKYNKTLGIPNEVIGLLFYVVVAFITAFLVIGIGPAIWLNLLIETLIFAGVLVSTYFLYLQWKVIKVWCFWCIMSTGTIFLMEIVIIISNFRS